MPEPDHRPGTADALAGQPFSLGITGLDTRRASALHFSATGLPPGLSIHAVPHSSKDWLTTPTSFPQTECELLTNRPIRVLRGITYLNVARPVSAQAEYTYSNVLAHLLMRGWRVGWPE